MTTGKDYHGFRAAGGRLAEAPLAHLDFHRSSLLGPSLAAIHAFDKAHAVMLMETGINPPEVGRAILRGLLAMEQEGVEEARAKADGGMHSGEHYLIKTLGEAIGGRLHIGRSSGDLAEVGRRMTYRAHVQKLLMALNDARAALVTLAAEHFDTVMPGYTHGQHAQPTTFAHWASLFATAFSRDVERLLSLYGRINRSPAGAAIMTGSDFPLDRQRVSDLLGFDGPLLHTWDAILSHDLEMEYAGHLAVAAQNLGRLADDLFLWSTTEFAMVEVPDRYCGTSSIMPQKKNPDGLEDMKGLAARALGVVVTVTAIEKGPTGFPIMERRHSQAILWELAQDLAGRLESVVPLLADLTVKRERMAALAGANWASATDLAAAIVRHAGIDWRSAHHIVGVLVRRAIAAGQSAATVRPTDVDAAAESLGLQGASLPEKLLAEALSPAAFVARRTLIGGPAPVAVARELETFRTALDADRATLGRLMARSEAASTALDARVRELAGEG